MVEMSEPGHLTDMALESVLKEDIGGKVSLQ